MRGWENPDEGDKDGDLRPDQSTWWGSQGLLSSRTSWAGFAVECSNYDGLLVQGLFCLRASGGKGNRQGEAAGHPWPQVGEALQFEP